MPHASFNGTTYTLFVDGSVYITSGIHGAGALTYTTPTLPQVIAAGNNSTTCPVNYATSATYATSAGTWVNYTTPTVWQTGYSTPSLQDVANVYPLLNMGIGTFYLRNDIGGAVVQINSFIPETDAIHVVGGNLTLDTGKFKGPLVGNVTGNLLGSWLNYTTPTLISIGYTTPTVWQTDYSTPSLAALGYSTPTISQVGYSTPSLAQLGYSTPTLVSIGYTTPTIAQVGYSTPTLADLDYSTPTLEDLHYSTPTLVGLGYATPSWADVVGVNGLMNRGNGNLYIPAFLGGSTLQLIADSPNITALSIPTGDINIQTGNLLITTGRITAPAYYGDGSHLTGLVSTPTLASIGYSTPTLVQVIAIGNNDTMHPVQNAVIAGSATYATYAGSAATATTAAVALSWPAYTTPTLADLHYTTPTMPSYTTPTLPQAIAQGNNAIGTPVDYALHAATWDNYSTPSLADLHYTTPTVDGSITTFTLQDVTQAGAFTNKPITIEAYPTATTTMLTVNNYHTGGTGISVNGSHSIEAYGDADFYGSILLHAGGLFYGDLYGNIYGSWLGYTTPTLQDVVQQGSSVATNQEIHVEGSPGGFGPLVSIKNNTGGGNCLTLTADYPLMAYGWSIFFGKVSSDFGFYGPLIGSVTGNVIGNVTGNLHGIWENYSTPTLQNVISAGSAVDLGNGGRVAFGNIYGWPALVLTASSVSSDALLTSGVIELLTGDIVADTGAFRGPLIGNVTGNLSGGWINYTTPTLAQIGYSTPTLAQLGYTTPSISGSITTFTLLQVIAQGNNDWAHPVVAANYSTSAGLANSAYSALTANTADSATNAGHATTADSATNATNATYAATTTNAGHATTADNATTSVYAGDAGSLGGISASSFNLQKILDNGKTASKNGVSLSGDGSSVPVITITDNGAGATSAGLMVNGNIRYTGTIAHYSSVHPDDPETLNPFSLPVIIANGNNTTTSPVNYATTATCAQSLAAPMGSFSSQDALHWWKMDDNAGDATVIDSADGKNGTAQQNTADLHTPGKIGSGAFRFNGSSDYVNCGAGVGDLTQPYAIQAWVYPNSISGYQVIASHSADVGFMQVVILPSGQLYFYTYDTVSLNLVASSISAGAWSHVVAVNDGSNLILYVNGSKTVGDAFTFSPAFAGNDFLIGKLGEPYDASLFGGQIDDVKFFQRVVTDDDVDDLYASGRGREGNTTISAAAGTVNTNGSITVNQNSATAPAATFINAGDNTNREGIWIQCGGNVSGGTNVAVRIRNGSGDTIGGITFDNSSINLAYFSDEAMKARITTSPLTALGRIRATRIAQFQRLNLPGVTETGFIAQELAAAFPNAVTSMTTRQQQVRITTSTIMVTTTGTVTLPDGTSSATWHLLPKVLTHTTTVTVPVRMRAIMPERLIVPMWRAIQEQADRNDAQAARIAALEAVVSSQTAALTNQAARLMAIEAKQKAHGW